MTSHSLKADVLGLNHGPPGTGGILKATPSQMSVKKELSPMRRKMKPIGHVQNDYENNDKYLKMADSYHETLRS